MEGIEYWKSNLPLDKLDSFLIHCFVVIIAEITYLIFCYHFKNDKSNNYLEKFKHPNAHPNVAGGLFIAFVIFCVTNISTSVVSALIFVHTFLYLLELTTIIKNF